MDNINKDMARMVAEMREVGELPAPSKGGSHNNLLRYNEMRERILEKFLSAFDAGYTLTPPNEPLTLDELRKGYNTPVWLSWYGDVQEWALVRPYSKTHLEVIVFDGEADLVRIDEYRRSWVVYRRPPEGEANGK